MKAIITILLFSINFGLFSQSNVKIGFKAGITLPNVSPENKSQNSNIEISNNIGYNGGISVNTLSTGHFDLLSELYYNLNFVNVKFNNNYSQTANSIDYKVEYIVYGVISKYNFLKSNINPYIFAGPNLSFYISDRPVNTAYAIPGGTIIQIKDNLKKTLFTISAGIGCEFKTSKYISIIAETQFLPGLMNAYEDENFTAKLNNLVIRTGLLINF